MPIADWLEKMERKIKDMETVPTDEEKIQQRIEEPDLLHDDILSAFDGLTDVATNSTSLVGEEEAGVLAERLMEIREQIVLLKTFKSDVDPQMVKVENLNR